MVTGQRTGSTDILVVPIEGVDPNYRAQIVAETKAAGAVRHCEK